MFKRLTSYLLLLAVMAAGIIPAGWMTVRGDDGKVLMVICTADGVQERWVDAPGAPGAPAKEIEHESSGACPFSGLNPDVDLPVYSMALVLRPAQAARWTKLDFTHRSAGFHWRYDARGPPALS